MNGILEQGDTAQSEYIQSCLQPPTKMEQIKMGVYDPIKKEAEEPPTLSEFKQWLVDVAPAFI